MASSTNLTHLLTQECNSWNPDPDIVLKALENGARPDKDTLTLACQKVQQAFRNCGPYGPTDNYLDDTIACRFSTWVQVVEKLVDMGAKGSPEACAAIRILEGPYFGDCYSKVITKVEVASGKCIIL